MTKTKGLEKTAEVITDIDIEAKVIVHNDDWHTFDQVIRQLILAIHCSPKQAEAFAFEIHNKGKATVFNGAMEECLMVSAVLEEIDLLTTIEA